MADVSVYGRLDAGYAATTDKYGDAELTHNGVQSHNDKSSLWGIKGSQDLGDGLSVDFKLEQNVYLATGRVGVGAGGSPDIPNANYDPIRGTLATNTGTKVPSPAATGVASFDRTSRINLSGSFGTVGFGRDYTPLFNLIAGSDINGLSRISTVQFTGAGTGNSVANQFFYSTPSLSGLKVDLGYASNDNSIDDGSDTYKATNSTLTATLTYTTGPLLVGVGYGSATTKSDALANATTPANSIAEADSDKTGLALVAGYTDGPLKVLANYISGEQKNKLTDKKALSANEINVGVSYVVAPQVRLAVQVGLNDYKSAETKAVGATPGKKAIDQTGTDYVVGAYYDLSKSTYLFAKTGTYGSYAKKDSAVEASSNSTAVGFVTVF
jgi:predicted porin